MKSIFDDIKKELDILLWIILIFAFNFIYPLEQAINWFSDLFTKSSFMFNYNEVPVIALCVIILFGLFYSGTKYATTQSDEELTRMDEREALHQFEVANIGYRVFVYAIVMYMLITGINSLLMLLLILVATTRFIKRYTIRSREA